MVNKIENWDVIFFKSNIETDYLWKSFLFLQKLFIEIFGREAIENEKCNIFVDEKSICPMFITNSNPISLRLAMDKTSHWSQLFYQLSHEMCHFVLRYYNDKKIVLKWFEEITCEALSLYILYISNLRWSECQLFEYNALFGIENENYRYNEYIKGCNKKMKDEITMTDLKNISNTCENNRESHQAERNYVYDLFLQYPKEIHKIIYYPLYISKKTDLIIDFDKWIKESNNNSFLYNLKLIQPCLINEESLEDSKLIIV